jgi:hypothetical protein
MKGFTGSFNIQTSFGDVLIWIRGDVKLGDHMLEISDVLKGVGVNLGETQEGKETGMLLFNGVGVEFDTQLFFKARVTAGKEVFNAPIVGNSIIIMGIDFPKVSPAEDSFKVETASMFENVNGLLVEAFTGFDAEVSVDLERLSHIIGYTVIHHPFDRKMVRLIMVRKRGR